MLTDNQTFTVILTIVCCHGVTELDLRSHPSGSSASKTALSQINGFDQLVHSTAEIRSVRPSAIPAAMAGPVFPYSWNPYPPIPGRYVHFYRHFYSGVGRPYGDFPDIGNLILHRL